MLYKTEHNARFKTDNIWYAIAMSRQFRRVGFLITVIALTLSTVSWHSTQASPHAATASNVEKQIAKIDNASTFEAPLTVTQTFDIDKTANWHTFKVKLGEKLADIRQTAGVSPEELNAVLALGKPTHYLNTLYPGDEIRILVSENNRLLALEYDILKSRRLLITRVISGDNRLSFHAQLVDRPLEIQKHSASGVITSSLFQSAKQQGLSTDIIMELVRIFDWDIDFNQDIKKGDRFALVYEQHFRAGEKITDGPIIAAQFVNNGKVYQAIRYTTPDGKTAFYTPQGHSLRKPFLRNPVDSAIVSSKFDPSRKHPILSTIRAHNGVDYAAKTGTPIKATGDGQIIFIDKKGGYGNTVIVQHSERRSTLYAHMQKFGKHMKLGKKVRQGEIIGYVGKTGRATGPHLHYEFRIDGNHVDPLSIKLAHRTIPAMVESDFNQHAQSMLAELGAVDQLTVAMNEHSDGNHDNPL